MLSVHIEKAFGIKVGVVSIAIQICYEFCKSACHCSELLSGVF